MITQTDCELYIRYSDSFAGDKKRCVTVRSQLISSQLHKSWVAYETIRNMKILLRRLSLLFLRDIEKRFDGRNERDVDVDSN